MRMIIFMAMSGLLFLGCNAHHSSDNLQLNNGAKWKVNAEMKPHIEKGNEILSAYQAQQSTQYNELAQQLKSQNDMLIESCTMQGESHDELHKWLHPHIELIKKLADAKDPKVAEVIVEQIEQSFQTYQNYFE